MTACSALDVPPRPPEVPAWKQKQQWVQLLVGGLMGGGVTLWLILTVDDLRGGELLLISGALLLVGWLQVLLHEAGHALAGLAAGLRLLALGVGPLRAERSAAGWRLHWAGSIRGIGGFALLLPRDGTHGRWQATTYLLGGPLANLLAAGLAWAAIRAGLADTMPWLALAWVTVATGLVLGLMNLLPFLAGGWSSDGRQLLKLWQGSEEARLSATLARIGGLAMLGVRPRDWPQTLSLDFRLDDAPQGVGDALARCQLVHAIDTRAFDDPAAAAAAARLAGGFWQSPDGMRQINALLLARWVLDTSGDAARADAWCALSEGGLLDQGASRAALRARIALLRGEPDEARKQLALAEQLAPRVPDLAGQAMLAESLAELREVVHVEGGGG